MNPQPNIFFYFSCIWLWLLRLCMRYPFEEENGICALLYTEKGRKKQTVIFGQYKTYIVKEEMSIKCCTLYRLNAKSHKINLILISFCYFIITNNLTIQF